MEGVHGVGEGRGGTATVAVLTQGAAGRAKGLASCDVIL